MEHHSAEALERRLAELKGPLVTELNTMESSIAFHESELALLRATRQRVLGVLAKLDPAEYGPKPKTKEQPKGQVVTPEEVKNVQTWLEANPPNGEGVWATRLSEDAEFREATKVRSGVITQALAELHEQSFLTLDRIGRGGSKIYKVVS